MQTHPAHATGISRSGDDTQKLDGRWLRGVFVVVQTPFAKTLDIDEESLRGEVDFLVRCGVHGVVWPVAASEVMSLSARERTKYAQCIVQHAAGWIPVVIAVTAANKFEAAEYAAHAKSIGASAVLTLPQTDYQATDPLIFAEYLSAIAEAAGLPIIVQTSYPGHGGALPPDFLFHLSKEIPLLQYVKEEQVGFGPLPWRISAYGEKSEGRISAFAGAGARNLMNEMARGSCGTMPGAGFADIQVAIWSLYQEGKTAEARDLFSKMLMMAVLEQAVGYGLQKEILRRRGIFRTALMRHTRRPVMDAGDHRELDAIFETLRPYFRVSDGLAAGGGG